MPEQQHADDALAPLIDTDAERIIEHDSENDREDNAERSDSTSESTTLASQADLTSGIATLEDAWQIPAAALISTIYKVAWYLPEVAFWTIGFYELTVPLILEKTTIQLRQFEALDTCWNLIDAFCSLLIGITLLLQTSDTPHNNRLDIRLMAAMYLGVGCQLAAATFYDHPLLPLSFALVAANDFFISLGVLYHAHYRAKDSQYWLNDTLAAIIKSQQHLQKYTHDLERFPTSPWRQQKEQRIFHVKIIFSSQQEALHQHLAYLNAAIVPDDTITEAVSDELNVPLTDPSLPARQQPLLPPAASYQQLATLFSHPPLNADTLKTALKLSYALAPELPLNALNEAESLRNRANHQQCQKAQSRSTVFLAAVIGWILLCFEKTTLEALVIVSLTAAYYLKAHALWLVNVSQPCSQRFFCTSLSHWDFQGYVTPVTLLPTEETVTIMTTNPLSSRSTSPSDFLAETDIENNRHSMSGLN